MPKLLITIALVYLFNPLIAHAETDEPLAAEAPNNEQEQKKQEQERPATPFDREWLINKAKTLSEKEFKPAVIEDDHPLSELDYDQYRAIRFQRGAAIWQREDRNFRVELLHPGFLFKTPVIINLVVGGTARQVLYSNEIFNYELDTEKVKTTQAPGYSGFRVKTPINNPDVWDEFLVFQGGSYFRAVGKHNWYGLSARGLAINTAKPVGEEFPAFTEFWIERPKEGAEKLVVHALLESQSVTGAYTFTASPGEHTTLTVESVLFPRKDLTAFGIAPLTSMFLYDATNRVKFDDIRPGVHDSDGLYITQKNGEKIWRPLANPTTLQASSFSGESLSGFGLMQRSRQFSDFEDIESKYEGRPSVWVEPLNDWGKGNVELIEIPTNLEIHDNIVAFWQPDKPMKAGEPLRMSYKLYWGEKAPGPEAEGRIVETRTGKTLETKLREFSIDYVASEIPKDLEISLSSSKGKTSDARGLFVEATGKYRVLFAFDPDGNDISEFRLTLSSNGKQWGETWLYRWTR